MIDFTLVHPRATQDMLGYLPRFLDARDPESAVTQLNANYQHGGGWRPFQGFTLNADDSIKYPGDPAIPPLAKAQLREETIIIYPHAWVAVIQPDRSFEICRMD